MEITIAMSNYKAHRSWVFVYFQAALFFNITEYRFGCACSCSVNRRACQTVTAVVGQLH